MSCPGVYPTVLNGQISFNDSNTAEYECLSGFYMTGNKRITCTAGVWGATPTCSVIRQYDEVNVFPDWWFYVLAGVLALLLLACFLCICLYFCCCRGANAVHPFNGYGGGGCGGCCDRQRRGTMDSQDGRGRGYRVVHASSSPRGDGNVFVVPTSSTPSQGSYYLVSDNYNRTIPTKSRATNTDKEPVKKGAKKPAVTKTIATNTTRNNYNDDFDDGDAGVPTTIMYASTTNSTAPRTANGYAWGEKGGTRSKVSKDSSNLETQSDGDLTDRSKPKKPAKEVKVWLPHANPVRNINTSTK